MFTEEEIETKRRSFSSKKKFKIVLVAIKDQRKISEIAAEFAIHPNQITNWKQQFLENGSSVFSKKPDTRIIGMEEKESVLLKKIGEQQVELDFLKDCQKKLKSWKSGNEWIRDIAN